MFSSISSYIWGESTEEAAPQEAAPAPAPAPAPAEPLIAKVETAPANKKKPDGQNLRRQRSSEEEDWVLVGDGSGGAAPASNASNGLNLGSLSEAVPRPPTGSTGSSSTPSEDGEMLDYEEAGAGPAPAPQASAGRPVALTRSQRRLLTPFGGCPASAALPQRKAARAAQAAKQKRAGKDNTAKATERRNKAVKDNHCSKKQGACRNNLAIKASGSFARGLKQC